MGQKSVASNLIWRLLERFGAQGVTFVVSIVLARLLDPKVYGTVALVTVIMTILQVFVDGGFGTALIQKKDADDIDFSSVFYFNVVLGVAIYIIVYLSADVLSEFYNMAEIASVVRVLGLTIIISSVKNVQQAYVSRNLLFKKFFFSTLIGTVTAACVGILLAYKGCGVWALVFQSLVNNCIDTIILWFTVRWRPKKCFSWIRLKSLLSYGWKLLVLGLINTIWNDIRQLIIGKKYSAEDLAYYNKANMFPATLTSSLNSSIDSVLFPVMSNQQDNVTTLKEMTKKSIKISSYLIWPMMVGLGVCAEPLICILMGEKWIDTVPYLQVFCIIYAFYPINSTNLNVIKALGKSDTALILEIIKKIVDIVSVLISMRISVFAMVMSSLITSFACQIINSWPNKKLLSYSYFEQLTDLAPSLLLSVFMGCVVYAINFLNITYLIKLIIQIPLGILVYCGASWILKIDSFAYCKNMVINMIRKKRCS